VYVQYLCSHPVIFLPQHIPISPHTSASLREQIHSAIRILNLGSGSVWIRLNFGSWIRICIEGKNWFRIRIKVMLIREFISEFFPVLLYFLLTLFTVGVRFSPFWFRDVHPGSGFFPSRVQGQKDPGSASKNLIILTQKINCFYLSSDQGCSSRTGSRIRILIFYPSRIQGSNRHRIPDLVSRIRIRNTEKGRIFTTPGRDYLPCARNS
jgi:hypothetical protein